VGVRRSGPAPGAVRRRKSSVLSVAPPARSVRQHRGSPSPRVGPAKHGAARGAMRRDLSRAPSQDGMAGLQAAFPREAHAGAVEFVATARPSNTSWNSRWLSLS